MDEVLEIFINEISELRMVGERMKIALLHGPLDHEASLALAFWEQTQRKPMPE